MGTKIEYVDETINPLGWGCYGMGDKANPAPCSYCYAHRLAKRNLRNCPECQAFIPHWHPEQLSIMEKWTKPKRIFIQSMGDLFHPDIPSQRIERVLDTIIANNLFRVRHTYFFLTKYPDRYLEFTFPDNCWLGHTITKFPKKGPSIIDHSPLRQSGKHTYLSIEPLLQGPDSKYIHYFQYVHWIILGTLTGPGAHEYQPDKVGLNTIIKEAERHSIPIFLKKNLLKLYPDLPKRQEMPL